MTKSNSAPANAPAVTPLHHQQPVPAELLDQAARDTGRGVSDKAEDQLIPLLYVEQTNSPRVDKRSLDYVNGDEAGHFYLRNALNPIRSGVEGLDVIPCGMVRAWIEWLPNRQGYVGRHDHEPADTKTTTSNEGGAEKIIQVRSNGNVIQDTREFYLLIDGQPYMLPCYGTRHTFARQWQTHFHQLRHPTSGGILPSWLHRYKLTTVPSMNAKGKWFGLRFTMLDPVSVPEYEAGKRLHEIVERGAMRTEAPSGDA